MDMDENLAVRNYSGKQCGLLDATIFPYSEDGLVLHDEFECVEDPEELIGEHFQFEIRVKAFYDLRQNFSKVSSSAISYKCF